MSNSIEQLFVRLKEEIGSQLQNPFYTVEIIVPDAHVKTVVALELAKSRDVLFGVELTTLLELSQKVSGTSFLDMVIAATGVGLNGEAAVKLANELVLEMWYGCVKEAEKPPAYHLAKQRLSLRAIQQRIPDQTHLFGVSALCPLVNDYLFERCSHADVIYYVLSACMHFWSDICSDQEAKRLTRRVNAKHAQALAGYLYDRSKLLANNGTRAREFMSYLEEKLSDFHEEYVIKNWVAKDVAYSESLRLEAVCRVIESQPTLLDVLQNDLLLMGRGDHKRIDFSKSDGSVELHKAPTAAREVEILYQYIQKLQPTLSGQIVVFAPDIEVYKPYIQSLFTHNTQIIAAKEGVILPLFLQIVQMPYKRMQAKKIFELFQCRPFRKKCGIEADDLSMLAACLELFDTSQEAFKEQAILSWITSSKRLIELTTGDAEVIGKCLATLESLYGDITILTATKTKSLDEWVKLFLIILEKYFEPSLDDAEEFYAIKEALKIVCQNESASHLEAIDQEQALSIVKVAIDAAVEKREHIALAPIVFASLGCVRILPREAVCFLGMNEGSFPRASSQWLRKLGFLHSAKPPYTVSTIDRHLFIEALLTTTRMLYISYQSYSYEDRSFLEPAGIIEDILETLDLACTIGNKMPSEVLINDHPLESCSQEGLVPQIQVQTSVLKSVSSDFSEVIYTHELSQVARSPLKAYMQQGLGLYLREYKAKVRATEFEVLDPRTFGSMKKQTFTMAEDEARCYALQQYRFLPMALKVAACELFDDDIEALKKNAKILGVQIDASVDIELSLTSKSVEEVSPGIWKIPALTFVIDGKTVALAGRITGLYKEGVVVFDKKSKPALFKAWPEILLANVLAESFSIQPKVLFIKDAKEQSFAIEDPSKRLSEYIAYALDCRKMPSCLYPDWIDELSAEEAPSAKLTEPSDFIKSDPYLELYLSRASLGELKAEWPRWKVYVQSIFRGAL